MKKEKYGLGRGMEDLFAENNIDISTEGQILTVPLSDVEPNRDQPRKYFDREKLEELAQSITEHGLLQPIIVRKTEDEKYQIISGERRWRASRIAKLTEIPVIVKEMDDRIALEIGLIENLQREDLNDVEEARGYKSLSEDFGMTQEEIAKRVGKSRPAVANAMRILSLPEDVLQLVLDGKITSGHARALLPLIDKLGAERVSEIAQEIQDKNLTVRDIEKLSEGKSEKKTKEKDIYYKEVEEHLSEFLGRRVTVSPSRGGKGKIEIAYYSLDDFNEITDKLSK